MIETSFLPPYSFLIGHFIGVLTPLVVRESADYDIFGDKVMFEVQQNSPTPVKINNIKVGDVNLPVVEIEANVHAQEGTFPVVKNTHTFIKCVKETASFITNNPGKKMEITVDDHKVVVHYDRFASQFEIKTISYTENDEHTQKEFATYADKYLTMVYGVKLVQEKNGVEYSDVVKGYISPDVAAYDMQSPEDKKDGIVGGDPYEVDAAMSDEIYNKQISDYTEYTVSVESYTSDLSRTIEETVMTCQQTLGSIYETSKSVVSKLKKGNIPTQQPQTDTTSNINVNLSDVSKDTRSIKEILMSFIHEYPWVAAGITVGAVTGAVILFMKRKAIRSFIARKFKREPNINKQLEYATYDIASVLTIVNPQLETSEIVDRALKMVQEVKEQNLAKLNKVYKSLTRESGSVGIKLLAIIAVLLKVGMFVLGAGIVAGLLGTIFLVIKQLIVGGVPMEYIIGVATFPIRLIPSLGVLAAGYVLIKNYLEKKTEMRTVSSYEIRSSLEKANSKMFALALQ